MTSPQLDQLLSEFAAKLNTVLRPVDDTERIKSELAQLHSVEQVMSRLNVGRNTVFNLISSGELRSAKVGRRRMVTEQAIRDYVAHIDQGK